MPTRATRSRSRLRRFTRIGAALALCAVAAVPPVSSAADVDEVDDRTAAPPRLESVASLPQLNGTNSAVIDDGRAYVSFRGGLAVVDVSYPAIPEVVHVEPLPEPWIPDESIELGSDTLVMSLDSQHTCTYPLENCQLAVFDRSDPDTPTRVATVDDLVHHNASCVADCTVVYTDVGDIVDLRDPTAPVVVGRDETLAGLALHELHEIAPGLMITVGGTLTVSLLDVSDPLRPSVLKTTEIDDTRVIWKDVPQRAKLVLDGPRPLLYVDTFGGVDAPDCDPSDGGTNVYMVDPAPVLEALSEESTVTSDFSYVNHHHRTGPSNHTRLAINCFASAAAHPTTPSLVAMADVRAGIELVRIDEHGDTTWLSAIDGKRESVDVIWLDDEHLLSVDGLNGPEVLRLID